jgi:hypothetical protein
MRATAAQFICPPRAHARQQAAGYAAKTGDSLETLANITSVFTLEFRPIQSHLCGVHAGRNPRGSIGNLWRQY